MAQKGEPIRSAGTLRPLRWLLSPIFLVALTLILPCAAALTYLQSRGPAFEAQAVVQLRHGDEAMALVEARLTAREALLATGARHGLTGETAATMLRQAIGLHPLTTRAGATLGLAPEVTGLVISVRLPEPEVAARVANDLALQVLDLGQSGQLDQNRDLLAFYRSEEERLWQEVAALKAEMSMTRGRAERASSGEDRPLLLLQDQYAAVRTHLAEEEIAARFSARQRAADYILLQRASAGQAVSSGNLWLLTGLGGAMLLSLALAFVVERRPWRRAALA